MADTNTLPAGLGSAALTTTKPDADVGDEVGKAGMALGDMIKHVGKAVAETQAQLNKTMVETANRLAEARVKVVAVRERHYNEFGQVIMEGTSPKVTNHHMELPAINFINPMAYQISGLRMQGEFQASEWKAHTESDTDLTSTGGRVSLFMGAPMGEAGGKLMGIANQMGVSTLGMGLAETGIGGSASFYHNNTHTNLKTDNTSDVSYGSMRMNALIAPAEEIGVPKPTQVFRGPSIGVLPGDPAMNDAKTSSSLDVMIVYRRPATTAEREEAPETSYVPIKEKFVIIEVPGCRWQYLDHPKEADKDIDEKLTGNEGTVHIRLSRDFPLKDPADEASGFDTEQKSFVLSARVGMIRTDVTLKF
ncbi:MAG TPA: hypothetical protein VK399_16970 [Longimicrobiaceae bacterium]|jgi:hypothetical protein|nr:hypothetical protein [Longimicrobiaceae bacterium]